MKHHARVTAAELREAGYAVPAHLPNVAWVPANSIKREVISAAKIKDENKAAVVVRLIFSEAFQWGTGE